MILSSYRKNYNFGRHIKVKETAVLSSNWGIPFEIRTSAGRWEKQVRESYETDQPFYYISVLPKRWFLPGIFASQPNLNVNSGGLLTEACAGLLEQDSMKDCFIKEARKETGYSISNPQKMFEAYMSQGSVTEIIHFFITEYTIR